MSDLSKRLARLKKTTPTAPDPSLSVARNLLNSVTVKYGETLVDKQRPELAEVIRLAEEMHHTQVLLSELANDILIRLEEDEGASIDDLIPNYDSSIHKYNNLKDEINEALDKVVPQK